MAAKKKTTKKSAAGQQRSRTKKKPVQKQPAQKQAVQKQPVQEPESQPATKKKTPAKKTGEKVAEKLSALDAAVRVLAESDRPMNCREMIEAMAEKGYWTSPAGKTPSATLYSAILRELKAKGESARFQKVERGRFTLAQDAR